MIHIGRNGWFLPFGIIYPLKEKAITTILGVFGTLFSPEGFSFSTNISENEELVERYLLLGNWLLITDSESVISPSVHAEVF